MSYPDKRDLSVVDAEVNNDSNYVSDLSQYGVPDFYEHKNKNKDCEDYAFAKRKILKDKYHWPWQLMRFAICIVEPFDVVDAVTQETRPATREERCHGILLVDINTGSGVQTMSLDNRKDRPTPFQETGYELLYVQEPGQDFMRKVKGS